MSWISGACEAESSNVWKISVPVTYDGQDWTAVEFDPDRGTYLLYRRDGVWLTALTRYLPM